MDADVLYLAKFWRHFVAIAQRHISGVGRLRDPPFPWSWLEPASLEGKQLLSVKEQWWQYPFAQGVRRGWAAISSESAHPPHPWQSTSVDVCVLLEWPQGLHPGPGCTNSAQKWLKKQHWCFRNNVTAWAQPLLLNEIFVFKWTSSETNLHCFLLDASESQENVATAATAVWNWCTWLKNWPSSLLHTVPALPASHCCGEPHSANHFKL